MRADIEKALEEGKSTFEYTGESVATRGQYGENVSCVHRLAWGVDCASCPHFSHTVCLHGCGEESHWYKTAQGHTWGVWDSTFGWQVWFSLPEDEIGDAAN